MKILTVDDDFYNLSLLKILLEKNGYEVVSAQNGEEALKKLRAEKFDLIISDILMPVMDGYKLVQTCKEDEELRHIPVIICTGTYIDKKDEQLALKIGAEAYIRKPFDHKALIQIIHKIAENFGTGRIIADQTEPAEDEEIYKLYSERLVHKLEKKMQDLDKEKMALEMEVADRKKIEEHLRKSRDYAESLFNTAPGIVLILDTAGRILRLNPYMEKVSGYQLDEVQGKNWNEIFSPENSRKTFADPMEESAGKNKSYWGSLSSIVTKDGERREIVWYDSPLKDNEGKVIGLLAIGQDITEQRKMQKNLFRAKKFEAVGSFAGGIAHDFNGLLTLILGNISLLEDDIEPGSETSECLTEAREAAQRAKEMASRLMLFARGRDPVRKSSLIGALVWDAVSAATRGFKIQCEFSIPEDLRPVEIDPWLMKHALHNVTLNSVEAMKGRGHIHVTCENVDIREDNSFNLTAGGYVKISVQDQGPGIAKEYLSKVFDPDFSTKDTGIFKGLGLGLSIVYSIIEKHHGFIGVTSEAGSGAAVDIYLPASTENIIEPENQYPAELPEQMTGHGERILVMDDEEPLRRMFKKMLNRLGYDAAITATDEATIKTFRKAAGSEDPFAAVILDMTHKFAISGEETISKLREINPRMKIVVCTGYPNDPIITDFKSHGFHGILIKPFTKDELGYLLAGMLRGKKKN